jgi:hypothetical protein
MQATEDTPPAATLVSPAQEPAPAVLAPGTPEQVSQAEEEEEESPETEAPVFRVKPQLLPVRVATCEQLLQKFGRAIRELNERVRDLEEKQPRV